jgi:hypothetical protein
VVYSEIRTSSSILIGNKEGALRERNQDLSLASQIHYIDMTKTEGMAVGMHHYFKFSVSCFNTQVNGLAFKTCLHEISKTAHIR